MHGINEKNQLVLIINVYYHSSIHRTEGIKQSGISLKKKAVCCKKLSSVFS